MSLFSDQLHVVATGTPNNILNEIQDIEMDGRGCLFRMINRRERKPCDFHPVPPLSDYLGTHQCSKNAK